MNAGDSDIVRLLLNGVNLRYSAGAPIDIKSAKKVILVLADQTLNTVTDEAAYAFENPDEDEPNAAVFIKCDITICGDGSLTVSENYNDGIAGKDGLILKNATIYVTSVDDGIRGRDYIIVKDARITVNAMGDGLKSDNDEDVAKAYILIESKELNINGSEGSGMNGGGWPPHPGGGGFLVAAGSSSGTANDGLYQDGSYSPGTKKGSFAISSVVTKLSIM